MKRSKPACLQARAEGSAREGAVHIILAPKVGDLPNFDPAGYSLGLPGPFDARRANSAVIVSTDTATPLASGALRVRSGTT